MKLGKRSAISGLPSGVSCIRALNGTGTEYWRVRVGSRFTKGAVLVKYFKRQADAREWLKGDEFAKLKAPSLGILEVVDNNRQQFEDKKGFWGSHNLTEAAVAIQRLEAAGLTLGQAVEFSIEHLRPSGRLLAWDDAISGAMLEQKENRKSHAVECAKRWKRLRKWAISRKLMGLNGFTQDAVAAYLSSKASLSSEGKRREIAYMSILFGWAVRANRVSVNPWLDALQRAKSAKRRKKHTLADEASGRVRIFTVPELRRILELAKYGFTFRAPVGADAARIEAQFGSKSITVQPWELVPWLVLGVFGGLRPEEARRLEWGSYKIGPSESITEVNVTELRIEVPAFKAKDGQERIIPMEPVLASWLSECQQSTGVIVPKNFQRKLWALRNAMGWGEWPKDITRHSYASYHLARDQKAHETAHNLGHRDSRMLYAHYRRSLKSTEDVAEFWSLDPAVISCSDGDDLLRSSAVRNAQRGAEEVMAVC